MKNRQVAELFLMGEEAKGSNFFSEKNNGKVVLFSYGYHFPMCVMLTDGTKLFNADGYSQTTKVQRSQLANALGFSNWADMEKNDKNLILLETEELNDIIKDTSINNEAEFLARNL